MSSTFYGLVFGHLVKKLHIREQAAEIYLTLNGFRDSPPKTLQDTANIYRISRERVRQIRESVEAKCRKSPEKVPHQDFFRLLLDDGDGNTLPINQRKLQKFNSMTSFSEPAAFVHIYDLISDAPGKIMASTPVCGHAQAIIGLPQQVEQANLLSEIVKGKIKVRKGARVYSMVPIGCASRIIGSEALAIAKQLYQDMVLLPGQPAFSDNDPENHEGYIIIGRQDNRLLNVAKKIAAMVRTATLDDIVFAYHRSLATADESIKLPSHEVVKILMADLGYGDFRNALNDKQNPVFYFSIEPPKNRVLSKTESALLELLVDEPQGVEIAAMTLNKSGFVKRLVDQCVKSSPVPVFASQVRADIKDCTERNRMSYNLAG